MKLNRIEVLTDSNVYSAIRECNACVFEHTHTLHSLIAEYISESLISSFDLGRACWFASARKKKKKKQNKNKNNKNKNNKYKLRRSSRIKISSANIENSECL